jgi:hypothetical protein
MWPKPDPLDERGPNASASSADRSGLKGPLCGDFLVWARLDSNQGLTDYESCRPTWV